MLNTIKFNCQLSIIIIALLSAIMMTSCIYEDDDSYIGQETKLARFIISVGNEQGGTTHTTKQTTEVTQAQSTPVFRGMQDMVLIPFRISGDEVTTSSRRLAINITLPAIGSIPQVSANNTINSLNATSNSQVYQDVPIVQGTNALLCYGKATGEDNMANGSLDYAGLEYGNVAGITFTPKSIYAPTDPAVAPTEATALTTYLTSIANTAGWSAVDHGKIKLLREAFVSQHAGSAPNVLSTLQKLYDALHLEVEALPRAIIASMKIGDGAEDMLHLDANDSLRWNDNVSFKDYPASISLPDGAAFITWVEDSRFESIVNGLQDNIGNEKLTPAAGVPLTHYATPAPLYYRTNTKIKVSNESQLEHYQNSALDWNGILAKYDSGDGEVTITTKSVALQKPLEYAVARMDAAVKAATAKLKDEEEIETDAADLELTGILINNQYAVDYEFSPITASEATSYIIYDNTIPPADKTTTPATPITLATNLGKTDNYTYNHTLVLPSKTDENVNIYLEFKNNSDHDITTLTGLVPPGCKLYLAGTITLAQGTQHYVFEQDKVTTFVATIADLKNACNVVPSMDVGIPFTVQVAVKDWDNILTDDHPIFNW